MTNRVFIAPFKTGLDTDISPFLAPSDSFEDINNFHIHHGYIEKRSGYQRLGYMVHNPIATITGITQANPAVVSAAGHTFTNGQQVLISNVSGMTEVNGNIYTVANVVAGVSFELSAVDSSGFTAYTLGGRAALYNGDRIMGIYRYIQSDGTKQTLIFDTTNAAVYNGVTQVFDPLDSSAIMSGSVTDYIWIENWQATGGTNRLYFSNGKAYDGGTLDGIRYYDPSVSTTTTTLFTPSLSSTRTLYGGKIIFAIKQRLLVLNTYENTGGGGSSSNFPQRARWCKAQNPDLWDDTVPGEGGFVDAPTGDQIISARPLQDAIIVFFSNSVWTLRPVSNPSLPFRWDKINDYRACNGKMATVQYDRYVMAFGVRGITATDGVETKRVDERIMDFTINEIETDQFGKVFCSRFFEDERMITLYANNSSDNNKALILDDESLAYTKYDISMNCLGYGNLSSDYALEDFIAANDLDIVIDDLDEETLESFYYQDSSDVFLGGNTGGTVYIMNTEVTDDGTEIVSNFYTNAWNPYQQEGKEAQLNYVDIYLETDKSTQITVEFYKDTEVTPYATRQSDILPPLGYLASIITISKENPANVNADNHGLSTGDVIYIYGVKGMIEISGEYTVTVVDINNFTLDGVDSSAFSDYTSGGQIVKNQYYRTKSWKRVLAGGIGFQHRMRLICDGLNDPLKIESLQPTFKPRGRRLIN